MWDKYDCEDLGSLDKIEIANFLTEILTSHGEGMPSLEKVTRAFNEFDTENEGTISKSQMSSFVINFVQKHSSIV